MNPIFDSLCTRLLAMAIFVVFPVASYPANAPSTAASGAKTVEGSLARLGAKPNHAMPRDIKKPIESPLGSPNDKKVTNDACLAPVAHAASAACGDAKLCVLASSPATQSGAKSKPNDAGRIEVTLATTSSSGHRSHCVSISLSRRTARPTDSDYFSTGTS